MINFNLDGLHFVCPAPTAKHFVRFTNLLRMLLVLVRNNLYKISFDASI